MESLGLIVLLDPAPFSKDETTTSNLRANDGNDVVAALVPEKDVWQFEVTKTCAREIQFQDREQESVATVDREDPNVSITINVCEARGEKLNEKEMRKRKAKEVQEFEEFEVKLKLICRRFECYQVRKCGQTGWKHERVQTSLGTSRLVSTLEKAALSQNQGPSVSRVVDGRMATLEFIRVSSSKRVHLTSASSADLKAWRNRDTISFYVVPPKDLRRKPKIWSLLKNRCGVGDTSQVFATCVEEGLDEHCPQKDALVPWWYWKATLKTCSVHWGDGFIPVISSVRANDLEQWMRVAFKAKSL